MEWITKHVDTVIVLGGILASACWMNGKFNEIDQRFSSLEKDVAVVKTILIMKGLMPAEIAAQHDGKGKE